MRRVLAVVLAAGLPLVAGACTGGDAEPAAPDDGVALEGDGIGELTLTGLRVDDEPIDLPGLRGRPVVINFFASTCAPCVREMPLLQAESVAFAGQVDFVGVAVADRREDALALVEQTGVTYLLANDPTGEVFAAAAATVLPTTIVLDAEGGVARRLVGEIRGDGLRDALAELGVEPEAS